LFALVIIAADTKCGPCSCRGPRPLNNNNNNNNNNSVALFRMRTIPTERPPLVGEVNAIFFANRGVSRGQLGGSLTAVFSVFYTGATMFPTK
jgi:hypothetical protein